MVRDHFVYYFLRIVENHHPVRRAGIMQFVDAIKRLDALAGEVLAVLVQVNESGSDHQPAGMDNTAAAQRLGRDADNLSVADADVAHGIHAGLGIHDPSAFEHEIVLLCGHNGG